MKSFKLAVIVSAVMLSVTGLAQADSANRLNHNFMSKRAYYAPLDFSKTNQADSQWEGATYRPADAADENSMASNNVRNLKQLKINSFARRAYM